MIDTIALTNTTDTKEAQELEATLDQILADFKEVIKKNRDYKETTKKRMAKINNKINNALTESESRYKEMIETRKELHDDLDKFILSQIKELSEDE